MKKTILAAALLALGAAPFVSSAVVLSGVKAQTIVAGAETPDYGAQKGSQQKYAGAETPDYGAQKGQRQNYADAASATVTASRESPDYGSTRIG
jgi:hypothetical protein